MKIGSYYRNYPSCTEGRKKRKGREGGREEGRERERGGGREEGRGREGEGGREREGEGGKEREGGRGRGSKEREEKVQQHVHHRA